GKSKLYVDYFKKVSSLIMTLGKRPMLWADVLLAYPEAIPDLPKEAVFVDWNYGWDPHRFGSLANIKKFELWGAPSLRSAPDSHSLSTWKIHFDNYKDYIPFARKSAFASTVLTSWSTSGEYGYEWETHGDVLEILPMRRVYPLAGFRILAAANIEAVKNKSPLSPKKFVIRYTQERFGLSARDGARLYDALTTNEAFLPSGVDAKVLEKAAKAAVKARRTLHALKPLRNKTELAHIQLMADFRELHTRLRKVEARIQSEKFALSHVPALQKELTKLVQENKKATSRYLKLNRAYLYPQQLEEETAYRTKKLHLLHQRLSRAGRD
ncbi:MAG: glycoside hydrolase family 20, partial [Chthoniobacterales bacterium]